MIEYLDKIGTDGRGEQWIVRVDGELGIAHVYDVVGHPILDQVVESTQLWVGMTHLHLIPVRSIEWVSGTRLVIITGDERGPGFMKVAKTLTDPYERTVWAANELASMGDAIGMMLFRFHDFVYRGATHDKIVVGADGHARLRAPIRWPEARHEGGWLGRSNAVDNLQWLSPEQVRGRSLTPASDVFQLAATLYGALTLNPPFRATGGDFETLEAIIKGPLPPPPTECSPELAAFLLRNLSRDPADRDRDPPTFASRLRAVTPKTPPGLLARIAASRRDEKPAPGQSAAIAGVRCTKRWNDLAPTTAGGIRHCAECKHDVIEVRSLEAIIPLLGKRCIAYRPE